MVPELEAITMRIEGGSKLIVDILKVGGRLISGHVYRLIKKILRRFETFIEVVYCL